MIPKTTLQFAGYDAPLSFEFVNSQTAAQLRLEPGSLGRHDIASIGYPDKLLHGNGIQCESCCHLTRVNPLLELAETSDTAYEVNTLRSTEILDVEELVEDKVEQMVTSRHPMGSLSS